MRTKRHKKYGKEQFSTTFIPSVTYHLKICQPETDINHWVWSTYMQQFVYDKNKMKHWSEICALHSNVCNTLFFYWNETGQIMDFLYKMSFFIFLWKFNNTFPEHQVPQIFNLTLRKMFIIIIYHFPVQTFFSCFSFIKNKYTVFFFSPIVIFLTRDFYT